MSRQVCFYAHLRSVEVTHIGRLGILNLPKILAATETSGQWLWYIRGVKDIIQANHLENRTSTSFVAELIDLANYHDVIAQFSVLHWRHGLVDTALAKQHGIKDWVRTYTKGPRVSQLMRLL